MRSNDLRFKYAPSHERGHDWRDDAACIKSDPELFFPVGNTGPALEQINRARKICASCPVIVHCMQDALRQSIQYGIAGGMTETERKRHKRELMTGKLGGRATTREVLVEFTEQQMRISNPYKKRPTSEVIY